MLTFIVPYTECDLIIAIVGIIGGLVGVVGRRAIGVVGDGLRHPAQVVVAERRKGVRTLFP
jgi:hypothetical protein